jgi:hypothetical protein
VNLQYNINIDHNFKSNYSPWLVDLILVPMRCL